MKKFGKMLTAAALAVSCMAITIPGYAAYSLSAEAHNYHGVFVGQILQGGVAVRANADFRSLF